MDKKEFALFAAALKTYYPKEGLLPNDKAMSLWFAQLQDIPYKVAEIALQKWVATNKWSPSIAEIRESCTNLVHGEPPDWSAAWEQVLKAISRYGFYRQKEALESLDDLTAECVRRIGFRDLCLTENIGYYRANFKTVYENLSNRQKLEHQLPEPLKNLIEGMKDKQRLELKE